MQIKTEIMQSFFLYFIYIYVYICLFVFLLNIVSSTKSSHFLGSGAVLLVSFTWDGKEVSSENFTSGLGLQKQTCQELIVSSVWMGSWSPWSRRVHRAVTLHRVVMERLVFKRKDWRGDRAWLIYSTDLQLSTKNDIFMSFVKTCLGFLAIAHTWFIYLIVYLLCITGFLGASGKFTATVWMVV